MCFTHFSRAQNKSLEFSLSPNASVHSLSKIDNPGIGLSGQVKYMFGKRIGFALDAGSITNKVEFDLPTFDFTPQSLITNEDWKTKYLTLGPVLRLGNKLHLDISPQIGLGKINAPMSELFFNATGSGTKVQLLEQGRVEEQNFDIIHNLGLRLGYKISDRLGVHANANLLGNMLSSGPAFYTKQRDFIDFNKDGVISQDEARDADYDLETSASYMPATFGAGLTYSLGGKKKDRTKVKKTRKPKRIRNNNKETNNSNQKSSCGVDIIADSLWCANPFYDANTNEYIYNGHITVTAIGARSMVLAKPGSGPSYEYRNIFNTNMGNITVDGILSGSGNCQVPSNWKQVLNGASKTFCVTFRSPTNGGSFSPSTMAYDQQYGEQNPNTPGSCSAITDPYAIKIPNCVCTNCDSVALRVDTSNLALSNQNSNHEGYKYGVGFIDPTITAQTPIKSITAEIIHYKHRAEKAECYTCNKESYMNGQFFNFKTSGVNLVAGNLGSQYGNRQGTLTVSDKNYGNQLSWTASNTATGVDISNGQRLSLYVAFPPMPELACCNDTIEVCIRYRITDINCNTCEVVKCYSDTRSYQPVTIGKPGVLNPGILKPGDIYQERIIKPKPGKPTGGGGK